jgi:hypothetical protein
LAQKPPAFQFYAKDWLTSPTVQRMTRQDLGDFINLLACAWCSDEPGTFLLTEAEAKGGAKAWAKGVAKAIGKRPQIVHSFLRRFPEVFVRIDRRLVNHKIHNQWLKYKEISDKRSQAAQSRYPAIAQQMHMQTGGSAFAVASASATAQSKPTPLPPAPHTGATNDNSKSPVLNVEVLKTQIEAQRIFQQSLKTRRERNAPKETPAQAKLRRTREVVAEALRDVPSRSESGSD